MLWGGNIGAVYPFMKVAFEGKSLQQWVDGEIDKAHRTAAEQNGRLESLQRELAAAPAERQPTIGVGNRQRPVRALSAEATAPKRPTAG